RLPLSAAALGIHEPGSRLQVPRGKSSGAHREDELPEHFQPSGNAKPGCAQFHCGQNHWAEWPAPRRVRVHQLHLRNNVPAAATGHARDAVAVLDPASSSGGSDPVWKRSGGELYYRNGNKMMMVSVTPSPQFTASAPKQLWRVTIPTDRLRPAVCLALAHPTM